MQASLLLITATTFGVDFGYQPMDDADPQSSEYIIQLQPHEFEALQSGMMNEFISYVPTEAQPVGRVKIVVGTQSLPRIAARPTLPRDSGDDRTSTPQLAQHLESQPATARGQSPEPAAASLRVRQPNLLRQPSRVQPPNLPGQSETVPNPVPPSLPAGDPGRTWSAPPFANTPQAQSTTEPRVVTAPRSDRVASLPGDTNRSGWAATEIPSREQRSAQAGSTAKAAPFAAKLPPFAAYPGSQSPADPNRRSTDIASRVASQPRRERSVMQPPQRGRIATSSSSPTEGPLLSPPSLEAPDKRGLVPVASGRQTAAPPRSTPDNLIAINRMSLRLPPFVNTPHPSRPPAARPAENQPPPAREPWIPKLTVDSRSTADSTVASRGTDVAAEPGREFGRGDEERQEPNDGSTVQPLGVAGWVLVVAGLLGSIGANFLQLLRNVSLRKRYLFLLRRTGGLTR